MTFQTPDSSRWSLLKTGVELIAAVTVSQTFLASAAQSSGSKTPTGNAITVASLVSSNTLLLRNGTQIFFKD
ncbi:MAG: hypothetical protein ACOH2R_24685 [Pseudomonas sp.]